MDVQLFGSRDAASERRDAFKRRAAICCFAIMLLSFALSMTVGCATTKQKTGPQTVEDVLSAEKPSW